MKKIIFLTLFSFFGICCSAQNEELVASGDEKMKKSDYAGAIKDYKKAFMHDHKHESALKLGIAYYYDKNYQLAEIFTTKATQADDKITASNAFLYRGLVRIARDKKTSGEYDLKKALSINPKNAEVYKQRALMFYLPEKQSIYAIQDLNAYMLYAPKSWENYNGLAEEILKTNTDDYDLLSKAKAFAMSSKAIVENPKNKKTLSDAIMKLAKAGTGMVEIKKEVVSDVKLKPKVRDPQFIKDSIEEASIAILDLEKLRKKAKVWAVVVGVSKYSKNKSLNLKYSDADAKSFYNFLHSAGGGSVQKNQIALLLNEQATSQEVRLTMKEIFSQASDDDVVVLYIASHGLTEQGEFYFLTTEAEVGSLKNTSLSRLDIAEGLKGCKAKKKMVFADACHSGNIGDVMNIAASNNTPEKKEIKTEQKQADKQMVASAKQEKIKVSPGSRGIDTDGKNNKTKESTQTPEQLEASSKLLIEMAQVNEGHAIMTASTGGQKSLEDIKWGGGHGVFTYYLIEGLKGSADSDKNKFVSFKELNNYVYRSVMDATNMEQSPIFQGTFDGNFPMSVVMK